MPAPTTSFNDGSLLRAGRLITIGSSNYIASDVKITDGVREHQTYGADDMPDGAFQTNDFGKLTATLIGKTGLSRPSRHDTFTYDTRTWVIGSVETSSADNDVTKWSISAREVINTSA